jgi:RND family efflux transporter MFP subunit
MKHVIYFPIAAALFLIGSCGKQQDSLEKLIASRDSLKQIQSSVASDLLRIEERIAALDTSQKMNLVSVAEATNSRFAHYFTAQASLEAEFNSLVFPEISGVVKSIFVKEGDKVSKGQKLLQLDTEVVRKSIEEVEIQYELAREVYNRQKNLWDQKIGSEIQFLEARTNKERLEKSLETLKEQLSKGIVSAPFNGVVDDIVPKIGEMASSAMPVARVINLSEMYLDADVSENYIPILREGMPCEVMFPGIDTLKAGISRIGNYINPENRTFKIRVDLKEQNPLLKPNLFATLRICDFSADSAVAIPAGSVLEDFEGRNYLLLVKPEGESEGLVVKRLVTRGMVADGKALISEGLQAGELYIDKGSKKVSEGERVRISNSQKSAE